MSYSVTEYGILFEVIAIIFKALYGQEPTFPRMGPAEPSTPMINSCWWSLAGDIAKILSLVEHGGSWWHSRTGELQGDFSWWSLGV